MEFPGALARFWHALGLKNAIWSGLTHVLHMKWWWQMDVLEVVSLGSKKALAWFGTMGRPSEIVVNQEYVHAGRRRILRIWTSVAQGNGTGFENVILSSGPICWIPLDSIGFYWILVSTTRCSTAIIDCAGCTATLTRGRSAKGLPGNGTKWAWSLLPCEDRNREETENPGPDSASFRSRVWGWDWFHAFNLGSFLFSNPCQRVMTVSVVFSFAQGTPQSINTMHRRRKWCGSEAKFEAQENIRDPQILPRTARIQALLGGTRFRPIQYVILHKSFNLSASMCLSRTKSSQHITTLQNNSWQ